GKPPEWWEKQKGSRGIRRGQWYRLVFQFPIREQLAHLIKIGRRYGVSVAIVPDTDSAELHELLSNAGSIERQFSIYERIQTKIAFTRCQEA
ncbi:hypothetical protein ACRWXX_26005, partial [Escherichia coli]